MIQPGGNLGQIREWDLMFVLHDFSHVLGTGISGDKM